MGTNYYVVRTRPTVEEPIHIGKGSIGWKFLFQSQNDTWHDPPVVWNSYEQVIDWLTKYTVESKDYVIIDEYDEVISLKDFIDYIGRKQLMDDDNIDNFSHAKNIGGYRFDDSWFR